MDSIGVPKSDLSPQGGRGESSFETIALSPLRERVARKGRVRGSQREVEYVSNFGNTAVVSPFGLRFHSIVQGRERGWQSGSR